MSLQDCIHSAPNLISVEDQFGEVDRFSYLGICVTPGGLTSAEVYSRILKARLAFTNVVIDQRYSGSDVGLTILPRNKVVEGGCQFEHCFTPSIVIIR